MKLSCALVLALTNLVIASPFGISLQGSGSSSKVDPASATFGTFGLVQPVGSKPGYSGTFSKSSSANFASSSASESSGSFSYNAAQGTPSVAYNTGFGVPAQGKPPVAYNTGFGVPAQGQAPVAYNTGFRVPAQGTPSVAYNTGFGVPAQGTPSVAINTGFGTPGQAVAVTPQDFTSAVPLISNTGSTENTGAPVNDISVPVNTPSKVQTENKPDINLDYNPDAFVSHEISKPNVLVSTGSTLDSGLSSQYANGIPVNTNTASNLPAGQQAGTYLGPTSHVSGIQGFAKPGSPAKAEVSGSSYKGVYGVQVNTDTSSQLQHQVVATEQKPAGCSGSNAQTSVSHGVSNPNDFVSNVAFKAPENHQKWSTVQGLSSSTVNSGAVVSVPTTQAQAIPTVEEKPVYSSGFGGPPGVLSPYDKASVSGVVIPASNLNLYQQNAQLSESVSSTPQDLSYTPINNNKPSYAFQQQQTLSGQSLQSFSSGANYYASNTESYKPEIKPTIQNENKPLLVNEKPSTEFKPSKEIQTSVDQDLYQKPEVESPKKPEVSVYPSQAIKPGYQISIQAYPSKETSQTGLEYNKGHITTESDVKVEQTQKPLYTGGFGAPAGILEPIQATLSEVHKFSSSTVKPEQHSSQPIVEYTQTNTQVNKFSGISGAVKPTEKPYFENANYQSVNVGSSPASYVTLKPTGSISYSEQDTSSLDVSNTAGTEGAIGQKGEGQILLKPYNSVPVKPTFTTWLQNPTQASFYFVQKPEIVDPVKTAVQISSQSKPTFSNGPETSNPSQPQSFSYQFEGKNPTSPTPGEYGPSSVLVTKQERVPNSQVVYTNQYELSQSDAIASQVVGEKHSYPAYPTGSTSVPSTSITSSYKPEQTSGLFDKTKPSGTVVTTSQKTVATVSDVKVSSALSKPHNEKEIISPSFGAVKPTVPQNSAGFVGVSQPPTIKPSFEGYSGKVPASAFYGNPLTISHAQKPSISYIEQKETQKPNTEVINKETPSKVPVLASNTYSDKIEAQFPKKPTVTTPDKPFYSGSFGTLTGSSGYKPSSYGQESTIVTGSNDKVSQINFGTTVKPFVKPELSTLSQQTAVPTSSLSQNTEKQNPTDSTFVQTKPSVVASGGQKFTNQVFTTNSAVSSGATAFSSFDKIEAQSPKEPTVTTSDKPFYSSSFGTLTGSTGYKPSSYGQESTIVTGSNDKVSQINFGTTVKPFVKPELSTFSQQTAVPTSLLSQNTETQKQSASTFVQNKPSVVASGGQKFTNQVFTTNSAVSSGATGFSSFDKIEAQFPKKPTVTTPVKPFYSSSFSTLTGSTGYKPSGYGQESTIVTGSNDKVSQISFGTTVKPFVKPELSTLSQQTAVPSSSFSQNTEKQKQSASTFVQNKPSVVASGGQKFTNQVFTTNSAVTSGATAFGPVDTIEAQSPKEPTVTTPDKPFYSSSFGSLTGSTGYKPSSYGQESTIVTGSNVKVSQINFGTTVKPFVKPELSTLSQQTAVPTSSFSQNTEKQNPTDSTIVQNKPSVVASGGQKFTNQVFTTNSAVTSGATAFGPVDTIEAQSPKEPTVTTPDKPFYSSSFGTLTGPTGYKPSSYGQESTIVTGSNDKVSQINFGTTVKPFVKPELSTLSQQTAVPTSSFSQYNEKQKQTESTFVQNKPSVVASGGQKFANQFFTTNSAVSSGATTFGSKLQYQLPTIQPAVQKNPWDTNSFGTFGTAKPYKNYPGFTSSFTTYGQDSSQDKTKQSTQITSPGQYFSSGQYKPYTTGQYKPNNWGGNGFQSYQKFSNVYPTGGTFVSTYAPTTFKPFVTSSAFEKSKTSSIFSVTNNKESTFVGGFGSPFSVTTAKPSAPTQIQTSSKPVQEVSVFGGYSEKTKVNVPPKFEATLSEPSQTKPSLGSSSFGQSSFGTVKPTVNLLTSSAQSEVNSETVKPSTQSELSESSFTSGLVPNVNPSIQNKPYSVVNVGSPVVKPFSPPASQIKVDEKIQSSQSLESNWSSDLNHKESSVGVGVTPSGLKPTEQPSLSTTSYFINREVTPTQVSAIKPSSYGSFIVDTSSQNKLGEKVQFSQTTKPEWSSLSNEKNASDSSKPTVQPTFGTNYYSINEVVTPTQVDGKKPSSSGTFSTGLVSGNTNVGSVQSVLSSTNDGNSGAYLSSVEKLAATAIPTVTNKPEYSSSFEQSGHTLTSFPSVNVESDSATVSGAGITSKPLSATGNSQYDIPVKSAFPKPTQISTVVNKPAFVVSYNEKDTNGASFVSTVGNPTVPSEYSTDVKVESKYTDGPAKVPTTFIQSTQIPTQNNQQTLGLNSNTGAAQSTQTSYVGGFGGPPGILKPNDFSSPLQQQYVNTQYKPSYNNQASWVNQQNPSSGVNSNTASYFGGFGATSGVLTSNQNVKPNSFGYAQSVNKDIVQAEKNVNQHAVFESQASAGRPSNAAVSPSTGEFVSNNQYIQNPFNGGVSAGTGLINNDYKVTGQFSGTKAFSTAQRSSSVFTSL